MPEKKRQEEALLGEKDPQVGNGQESKKKKKKEKKEAPEPEPMEVEAAPTDKKQKKNKSEDAAAVAPAQEKSADAEGEGEKKKKKKKSKERNAEGANAAAPAAAAAAPVEKGAPEKKRKQVSEEEEEEGDKKKSKSTPDGAIKFNFYKETHAVAAQSDDEVAAFRQEAGITVEGPVDMKPLQTFAQGGFLPHMLAYCKSFDVPTPIQRQCWPLFLSGHDAIGISATGSGKTMAFGFPGLMHVAGRGKPRAGHPFMVVLAPTRELAVQTGELYESLSRLAPADSNVTCLCVYGGVSKSAQKAALKKDVHVLVATPGRLMDLMDEGCVNLSDVSYFVLDEADRMLDLGFERDIKRILAATPSTRQTLMLSATWPLEIQGIALSYMKNPVRITVGSIDLSANKNVKQIVEVIDPRSKETRLLELLRQHHACKTNRILIFVLYKKEAVRIEQLLQRKGFHVGAIHGDLAQSQRTQSLQNFRDGTCPLLIATDVAARGLDIPKIELVINVTFPLTVEDYVHRIGRTGRAGRQGISITFFTDEEKDHAGGLANVLREAGMEVPADLMKYSQFTKKKVHKMYGDHFRALDGPPAKASHVKFDD